MIIKVNVERSGQSPDVSWTQSSKYLLVKDVKYKRKRRINDDCEVFGLSNGKDAISWDGLEYSEAEWGWARAEPQF